MRICDAQTCFELSIVSYQYNNNRTDYYDANWLEISIAIESEAYKREYIDPCLLTDEWDEIINSFIKIQNDNERKIELEFIEPVLTFIISKTDAGYFVTVKHNIDMDGEWEHEFKINKRDFAVIIEDMKNQLEKFPAIPID